MPATPPPEQRDQLAFVVGPTPAQTWDAPPTRRGAILGVVAGHAVAEVAELDALLARARELEARRPRWVWWDHEAARVLVEAGVRPARAWDIAHVRSQLAAPHPAADPYARPAERRRTASLAWAHAFDLDPATVPASPRGDMLDALGPAAAGEELTLAPDPGASAGHLRPDAAAGTWQTTDERLNSWARAALDVAARQHSIAAAQHPRLVATLFAESATVVLCEELYVDGLPVDRAELERIITPFVGPPAERDERVWATVPGSEGTDLRNPATVKALLGRVGIDVPNTRKHTLAVFRDAHPLVDALLEWRVAERIATTYGTAWLAAHVGADQRLRGRWRPSDGAAGRMTAEAGLHNLPAMLRPGVAADDGWVLVRADLGQIEPRVLAVVSGDRAFAEATRADDLYAPVAQRLGVERAVAKVAVLAAMYGQRSGAAGRALEGLERAYPTAMGVLDRAYDAGRRGHSVRTWGGREVHTARALGHGERPPVGADPQRDAARGRFARNALIQGAAAEFFKAWVATVRAGLRELGESASPGTPRIVMCLHDELVVHAPAALAEQVVGIVETALEDSARRWTGGAPVRFVADVGVVRRWSEAK